MATEGADTTRASRSARGLFLLARVVDVVTAIVCLLILAGILLVILKANLRNDVAQPIHDVAKWLTTPFHGLFHLKKPRTGTAVNWGVALIVYFVVGRFVAAMISRVAARRETRV